MGFITRAVIPSKVRRVAHPVRAVKRTVVPRPVRQAQSIARSVTNPVSALGFAVENSAVRAVRGGGRRLPSGYSAGHVFPAQTAREQKAQEVRGLARFLDDLASVHEQEFPAFVNPNSWSETTMARFTKQVAGELKKGIPLWSRSRRSAAKAAVAPEVQSRLREMTEAAQALEKNVPEAVLASLDVAFDDNATPAFPIGCRGDVAVVALLVRDAESLLGNRDPGVTKAGNPSLKVWPKRDRNQFYRQVIRSDVVATVKEGFANAPGIETINVVVIRQTELDGSTRRMDAVIHFEVPRRAIEGVDWSKTAPSVVLNELPVIMDINRRTEALEPLASSDHPDIARVLSILDTAPSTDVRRHLDKAWRSPDRTEDSLGNSSHEAGPDGLRRL